MGAASAKPQVGALGHAPALKPIEKGHAWQPIHAVTVLAPHMVLSPLPNMCTANTVYKDESERGCSATCDGISLRCKILNGNSLQAETNEHQCKICHKETLQPYHAPNSS